MKYSRNSYVFQHVIAFTVPRTMQPHQSDFWALAWSRTRKHGNVSQI